MLCDHVQVCGCEAVQHRLPAGAGSPRQHLQPAGAAVEVRRCEDRGSHHLLHLFGKRPAAELHLRPRGASLGPERSAGLDLPLFFCVVLFVWLSSSSVSFWPVALAGCPLLRESFELLLSSLHER